MMTQAHIFLAAGWILYCCLHSVLAYPPFKQNIRSALGWSESTYRVLYNLWAFAGLVALVFLQATVGSHPLWRMTWLLRMIAWLFTMAGSVIMALCIVKYFAQLSGINARQTPGCLQTGGLHRFVRHPLYLGTFIFLTGLLLFFPLLSNLLTVGIIIIYTIIGIRFEEQKLMAHFGSSYTAYKKNTPMLIPGLRVKR